MTHYLCDISQAESLTFAKQLITVCVTMFPNGSAWNVRVVASCSCLPRLLLQPTQLQVFLYTVLPSLLVFLFFSSQGLASLQIFSGSGIYPFSVLGHTSEVRHLSISPLFPLFLLAHLFHVSSATCSVAISSFSYQFSWGVLFSQGPCLCSIYMWSIYVLNLWFRASPTVDTEDDRDRSIRKAMAEIVIMLVFLWYLFFNAAFSFVNGLPPLLSILCKSLPVVHGDVCSL